MSFLNGDMAEAHPEKPVEAPAPAYVRDRQSNELQRSFYANWRAPGAPTPPPLPTSHQHGADEEAPFMHGPHASEEATPLTGPKQGEPVYRRGSDVDGTPLYKRALTDKQALSCGASWPSSSSTYC
eukprot:Opistho-1_new@35463